MFEKSSTPFRLCISFGVMQFTIPEDSIKHLHQLTIWQKIMGICCDSQLLSHLIFTSQLQSFCLFRKNVLWSSGGGIYFPEIPSIGNFSCRLCQSVRIAKNMNLFFFFCLVRKCLSWMIVGWFLLWKMKFSLYANIPQIYLTPPLCTFNNGLSGWEKCVMVVTFSGWMDVFLFGKYPVLLGDEKFPKCQFRGWGRPWILTKVGWMRMRIRRSLLNTQFHVVLHFPGVDQNWLNGN